MKAIIRIRGQVRLDRKMEETLNRLNLRKKYSCIVINPNAVQLGMIKKIKDFVAFGDINKETFEKLIEFRGKVIDKTKKIDSKKIVAELEKNGKYKELNLIPFFRLHPPRGGIDTKEQFPVGVLGDHKDKINDLIKRML